MDDSANSCLIGVDGGGTACRVALVCAGRRHEVTLGAANAASDRVGAIATVSAGIQQVRQTAGIGSGGLTVARSHVALAGIMNEADAGAVATGLKQALGLVDVRVSDDRVSTVTGALGTGDGALAGIGTGSFLARQSGGRMRFVGGWGPVAGDEASGAWLGRRLLSASLHVVDGMVPGTGLSETMMHRFGTAADIVGFAGAATPREFADLAPSVVAAAEDGDALATGLMREGAGYILRGLTALGWTAGEAVCLTGGLGALYEPWLAKDLRASLRMPIGSALDGALQLAARTGAAS